MKDQSIYESIFQSSPMGYAYHKVICNMVGVPVDYEFIEVNSKYEELTGIKRCEALGKKASEVIQDVKDGNKKWVLLFGDVALSGANREFIQYLKPAKQWYKVNVYSPKKGYFVTVLMEISDETAQSEAEWSQIRIENTYEIARLRRVKDELKESKKKLTQANEMMQTVLDTIPMPVFWKDRNFKFLGCNSLFAIDAGKQSPSELVGDTDYNMPWKDLAELYRKDDLEIMSSGVPRINYEEPHTSSEGDCTWVRTTKVPLIDEEGNVFGLMGAYEDITERKLAEQALYYEKERLKITLHSIADGVIATNSEGIVLLENSVAEKLTGWPQEMAEGRYIGEIFNIINEQTRNPCENPIDIVMRTGKVEGINYQNILISKDGSEYAIDNSAAPIMDKDGLVKGAVLVFRDVTEKRKKEKEFIYLSYHDSLTGLYNRRFFEDRLKKSDIDKMLPLSIIMGDVNGLKFTNDVFGHMEGDRLLVSAAEIIKDACGTKSIIARWGGDEFIILLPNTLEETVREICRKIDLGCSAEVENTVNTSISLGYAIKENPQQDIMKVIKSAEDSLYRQKFQEKGSFRSSIVASIQKTLYQKSHETEEHAERIKQLSKMVGVEMGLTEIALHELELLAVLHDIGKIAISENILNNPRALTEEEWLEIKRHPEVGFRIAQSVPELTQIAEYILAHHERWDGMGYPRGLKKIDIPLMSRIIAVVDAYDAMICERPYRKAMTKDKAVAEILKNSGTQFDPDIVNKFLEVLAKL